MTVTDQVPPPWPGLKPMGLRCVRAWALLLCCKGRASLARPLLTWALMLLGFPQCPWSGWQAHGHAACRGDTVLTLTPGPLREPCDLGTSQGRASSLPPGLPPGLEKPTCADNKDCWVWEGLNTVSHAAGGRFTVSCISQEVKFSAKPSDTLK